MAKGDLIIRLGGEGGEGVISAGDMFTSGAARAGYHIFTFRTYPAEIKGGHAWYQVRLGGRPVLSLGDGVDVLVAFNAAAYHQHIDQLNSGGVLIYDPETVTPANGHHIPYPIPFTQIAREELDFPRGKNLVVLGVLARLFGLDHRALAGVVRARLSRRAELLEQNLVALEAGANYAQSKIKKEDPYYLEPAERVGRLVMSGNEAVVAGALLAGCRFFAGYPITPASDILEAMARELPPLGGVCLQAEDEIAAIGAVVGASYAGTKAMTATSGPGFSLMTEFLGYSAMAEIPVVVVDAQRGGPSSGLPTKLEQGDFNQAFYGGHGDFPRIVIAPGSVEDCFCQIINAFNLAEEHQGPVILLSDQSLSHRTQTMDKPNLAAIKVVDRERPAAEELRAYKRYALTQNGMSPMALPGDPGGIYVSPGLEHDEYGHVQATDPDNHRRMTEKRFRKLAAVQAHLEPPARHGPAQAQIGVIGWGSTEGPIREAVDRALQEGYSVATLHPKVLSPLPERAIGDFLAAVDKVIVPESNYQGQFALCLAAVFGIKPIRLSKYGGLPFTPGEIYRQIVEVVNDD